MKRWWVIVLVVILLSGCSGGLTGQAASNTPQEHIDITKYSYDPLVLYTKPGTEVTWTNKDSQPHTITILGQFDSGTLGRRHSFTHKFTEEGTYTYSDLFNHKRIGKVVVRK